MIRRTFVSVSLTVIVAAIVLAVAVPGVVAQDTPDGEVEVRLSPEQGAADEGETRAYEVVVVDAAEGIGAYELNVSVDDTGVGQIVDYELAATQGPNFPIDGSQITADNGTLALEVALGDRAHDANQTAGAAFTVATVAVAAVGGLNESTNLTVDSVENGFEVAKPDVGLGNDSTEGFYDVPNLPAESFFLVSEEPFRTEVDLSLEPASAQAAPGETATYEVVLNNSREGLSGYRNVEISIDDPGAAQFVDFVETATETVGGGQPPDSQTTIRAADGTPADEGPLFTMNATLNDGAFGERDEVVIAELETAATGALGTETGVNVTAQPVLLDSSGQRYLTRSLSGAEYRVTADLRASLPDQRFGDAVGGVQATVEGVDTAGVEGALLVTYENETTGETVVAGLETGEFDNESVPVVIEDTRGFSPGADGRLVGTYTVQILLADQLSSAYAPGDPLSAATNSSVVERSSARLVEPSIPELDGLDVSVLEGLTVADGYPLNERAIFDAPGSIYERSGISLPPTATDADERYAPVAAGQHVGLGGLPVQTETYGWAGSLLGFQTDRPEQVVAVSFAGDETSPVTLSFDEAAAHGLRVAEVGTVAGENIPADAYDLTLGDNGTELVVTFDESAVGPASPTLWVQLFWAAQDPVEGLAVDEPNGIDYETDHRVRSSGNQARDNFVVLEAGRTGISHADTDGGFLGEPTAETDLKADIELDGAANGTANSGAFLVWQNQRVSFETAARGNTVDIFEVGTTTVERNGSEVEVYELGAKVPNDQVGFADTAPGQVANLNTSNLTAGQRYFVTFGGNSTAAVVLDVRSLDLAASTPGSVRFDEQNRTLPVAVTSDDTTGGAVEAWFHHEGTNVSDVVHVERDSLTGSGNRELEVVPSVDLVGPGNYTVTVRHAESGVVTTTEFEIEQAPSPPPVVPADDVNIVSPDLLDPAESGIFDRGDIVPIELELEGGNVATVTFGGADEQNVAAHATVYDPTFDAGENETTLTVYLNTYQVGHGYIESGTGDLVPNRPSWRSPGDWEDRQHGFFTDPRDSSTALLDPAFLDREHNAYVNETTVIYGGSQGGAVLSPGDVQTGADGEFPGLRYDLHVAGNRSPHTAPGVDRDDVNALDIEQRATEQVTPLVAPGEGDTALDVDNLSSVADINNLVEQGLVTELETEEEDQGGFGGPVEVYNDTIAENDFLVVRYEASGIEGVIHEAVERSENLSVGAFLDRRDGNITAEFTTATEASLPRVPGSLLRYTLNFFENAATYANRVGEPTENVELVEPDQVVADLPVERVLAGTDANGNLNEFVVPYKLEPGDELLDDRVDADEVTFEAGFTFDTDFSLEPGGGEQAEVADIWGEPNIPVRYNPPLSNGSLGTETVERIDFVTPAVSLDDRHVGPAGLAVPPVANYTLTGTTTAAPGTTLDIEMITDVGEDTQFTREFTGIETTEQPGSARANWSVTVDFSTARDGVDTLPGTSFETTITRSDGTALAGGNVSGQVLGVPAVETFSVTDQRTAEVLTVAAYEANRRSRIVVEDADGTVLGTSEVLDRSRHENVPVVLEDPVESNQAVTVVAEIVEPEVGEVLAEETVEISVEDAGAPFFQVSDLAPTAASVAVGDEVEVSATVTNAGGTEGTQAVTLSVTGLGDLAEETVTLGPGESQTVAFDPVGTGDVAPGNYEHRVASANSSQTGSLVVDPESEPPEPAAFELVQVSPAANTVVQNDTIVVDVTVQNTGEAEATETVTLDVDGIVREETVTLAGGEVAALTFETTTEGLAAQEYTYLVSTPADSVEGTLTVTVPTPADDGTESDDNTSEDDADGGGAGFGVPVAALALLGAALLAARRRD